MPRPADAPTRAIMRNIRILRDARGWSGEQLSRRLHHAGSPTNRDVIANIETGRNKNIPVGLLYALARVFEVEPWVLTDSDLCINCRGMAPAGFKCLACGRETRQ